MMRKHKKQPSVPYSVSEAVMQAVFQVILTLLCFFASMQMMQDIFPEWVITGKARVWICVLVIVTAFIYEVGICALPRFRVLCGLLTAGVYAALICRYAEPIRIDLEDGACAFAMQFLEKYNKHLKTSYTIWEGKKELLGMSLALLMLVVVLALLILALLLRRRIILLICPLTVLSGELLVGYVPQWPGLALFFTAILFMAAGEQPSGRYGRKMLRMRMDGLQSRKGSMLLRWLPPAVLAAAACLLLAAGTVVFEAPAGRMMEKNAQIRGFQQKVERNLAGVAAFFSSPQEEDINNDKRNYTGREVMKITAAKCPAEDVFLKGFCGTDYENGRWICKQQGFADACEQAGYTQEDAARELLQAEYDAFISAAGNGQETNETATDFTIEYTGLRSRNAYLPYIFDISGSGSRDQMRLSGDTVIRKPWGQDRMEFHGWKQKINAQIFAPQLQLSVVPNTGLFHDTESDSEDITEPFQWYHAFVYDAYLSVPDNIQFPNEIVEWMMYFSPSAAIGYSFDKQYMYWNSAKYVRLLLDWYMDYNLELDAVPEGMDTLNYFFQVSREGYCVHFASAAVLMLRNMGIPARYASGYVAKQKDFHPSASGYTAVVRDRNAHAWAEIYMDDIGWVPVDVTPSGGHRADATVNVVETKPDEETKADPDTLADTDTKTEEETKADTQTKTDPDTLAGRNKGFGRDAGLKKWVLTILAAAGLILFLISGFFAVQRALRIYHQMPEKDMQRGRYRSAVIRLNRRIYRRLCIRGKIRQYSMCDADYEKVLQSACPNVPGGDWKQYMCIIREAAFSGQELEKADACFCYRVYNQMYGRQKR